MTFVTAISATCHMPIKRLPLVLCCCMLFIDMLCVFTNIVHFVGLQATGNLSEAEAYCLQLLDYGAPSKEKAKSLLREIRSLQRHQHTAPPAEAGRANTGVFTTPVPMPLNALAHHQQEPNSPTSDEGASPMSGS